MYKVLMRDNQTREERWCESNMPWEDHSEFLWTEGNYGCDCNRHLLFAYAGGEESDDAHGCGDTRYTAVCAQLPDGTRIALDEDLDVAGGK